MEGFSTEVNVIVEKCVLIPGLRPWYEYGRVKTLKVCTSSELRIDTLHFTDAQSTTELLA
jgi:hypothetical protein